jgi:HK97 family phage portal protein
MGIWSRLLGLEQRNVTRVGPLELFRDILMGGRASKSGVSVTSDTAMQVTTVLSAARVLAEDVSGLPLKLYEQQGAKRVLLSDDPIQAVLDRPNDWQTGMELREQLMLHAVLCGNGVAWKNVVRGEVRELLPLLPSWYTIEQRKDWSLVYKVRLPDGPAFDLPAKSVLHLRGPSWGGGVGLDIIRLAREAIGLALATESAHAAMHANGLQTPGLYSVDGTLNSEQYQQLRAHIEANQSGQDNAFRLFLLDRSAKYTPIGMTGVDAQHLETRRYQVEEVCRALRVFPQMVGYSDKASTFASAEQFFLAHVKYSLLPWVRRWEGVGQRDLIGRSRPGVYLKHNVAALERADIKTRYTAYGQGIKDGWLLRNEARGWEDLDDIEGLSEPLQPLNMATPDQAAQQDNEAGGGSNKGRRPFADETRAARRFLRDALGRFASFDSMLASVLAEVHPTGALARIGKLTKKDRLGLKKAGVRWSGGTVHAEDRVLKKAMRTVGTRKPATAADLRAIPSVMRAAGGKSYIDRTNGTLVRVRPAPDADGMMVKYVIRPASPQGGNRLVTVQRVAAKALQNPTAYQPV